MADVNFGPAHSIEFWYITRHGFQHVSSNGPKQHTESDKKAQKADHDDKTNKGNKEQKKDQHKEKNEHRANGAQKEAKHDHSHELPDFGHVNHLLYWWVLKHHAAPAQKAEQHSAKGSKADQKNHKVEQHSQKDTPKKVEKAKENHSNASTPPVAQATPSSSDGAAKKKKKKPAKKEIKEPTGEVQTATSAEQVRDFLTKNANFVIAESLTDLGEHCVKLSHAQAVHLAKVLSQQGDKLTLKALHLSGSNLQVLGAQALVGFLEKNATVTELDLSECALADEGVSAVVSALRKNTRSAVKSVNLANNRATEKSAQDLSDLIGNSSTILNKIVLDGNELGTNGLKRIVLAIQRSQRSLETLSLAGNQLNADAGSVIGGYLANRETRLVHLNLQDNQLGDRGAVLVIADGATNNRHLKTIDLSKNGVTTKGYEELNRLLCKRVVWAESINWADNTMGRLNESRLVSLLKKNHETKALIDAREAKKLGAQ